MGGKISYYYPCHIVWKNDKVYKFCHHFFFPFIALALSWMEMKGKKLLQKQEFDGVSGVCVAV
jgi:Zn-finger protein